MYVIWVFYLNMPDFIDVTLIQTYKLQSLFTHNADMLHLFSANGFSPVLYCFLE